MDDLILTDDGKKFVMRRLTSMVGLPDLAVLSMAMQIQTENGQVLQGDMNMFCNLLEVTKLRDWCNKFIEANKPMEAR